ncbi:MAG: hypothetical protein K9M57_00645 [Phycisphaerae bacterium]|nr:hypothetical protein [Phycisphaerae bacterium]
MKKQKLILALTCFLAVQIMAADLLAQAQSSRRGRGVYGDWDVKVDYDNRQMESILSFSRDEKGKMTGEWISFWGVNDLTELEFQDSELRFNMTRKNRDGNTTTTKFTGTIKEGKLSGTLVSDRGENKLTGERSKRVHRAVGSWEMKLKMGEREITSTLVVKADKEGKLTAEWQSEQGEHKVSDLEYQRGKLSFKRSSKIRDRQFESTFEGTLRGDTLSGTIKSERGEVPVEGERIGTALIGTWNLEVVSERGNRKQRLLVNPDMTGLMGAMNIKKVNFEGDQVSFSIAMEFGERKFEMSFKGKIKENSLTGEWTSSRGSQKVTGKKVVRTFRRAGQRGGTQ